MYTFAKDFSLPASNEENLPDGNLVKLFEGLLKQGVTVPSKNRGGF